MTAFVLTGENLTKRYLPLGAPSSPWLSNLVFQNVDFQILNLLKDKKIQYTRYADDLMFSSDYDDLIWLKDEVEKLLSNHKFIINAGKTKLFTENDQKLLMGGVDIFSWYICLQIFLPVI